ncbi:DUF4290 domain-containing protein [soil metagenome]
MNYNTERGRLEMTEYGRNVQRMVEYLLSIEDDKKRNEQAKIVIELMGQLNPHLKNVEDFRHKLWDHIIIMSDFKLQVESPYPIPDRETIFAKPERIPYPQSEFKHRHYGKNIETLIEKAIAMEDAQKRQEFAEVIGNYMKLVHTNWNNETVNNQVIVDDLERMSRGKLKLDGETNLDLLAREKRASGFQQRDGDRPAGNFKRRPGGPNKNQGGGGQPRHNKNFKPRHKK